MTTGEALFVVLVVTANWAIADGTVHGGPPPAAVRTFFREVRRAAWRAGFRHDGLYSPIDSIQIVLAGDTFDGLTSLAWRDDLRPWQGGPRARAVAEQIAATAARRGRRLLAGLGRLQRDGLSVPQADERGRPVPGTTCQATVTGVCLVGDRDRVLDGHGFAALAARHGIQIGQEWSSDAIVIRHGSECDPLCGPPDLPVHGRSPTLAESLTVDLLVDFARRLHGLVAPRVAAGITRRLATASPLHMPRTIAGCQEPALRAAWQRSVSHWHSQAHATMPEAAVEHDAVDALAGWLEAGIECDPYGSPRPLLSTVIDGLQPRAPRHWSDQRQFVLGHPPGRIQDDSEADRTSGICLGPAGPLAQDMPAAVVFPVDGSHHGIWLTGGQWKVDRVRTIHVAHGGVMSDEPGIVDAA